MITDLQFNKLLDYVKELARQHNELEQRVAKLERDSMLGYRQGFLDGEEATNFEGRDE
jgi:hypothetical protein